ncbi:MAG: Abi family protein [Rhodocyclaceae bacterium]|nr:Abi family protein [Rhodocyclaceae bacterium]MCW5594641.1 Abi family protein [Rhodocyclaceae bacterium]
MRFAKPALTVEQQVELLEKRGMAIPDRTRAAHYLTHINYYRLRAYWLPFEEQAGDGSHRFRAGTSFEDALTLYLFDRKLRLMLMDAIERVEVAVRTRWAHVLALRYGPHAYLRGEIFQEAWKYRRCLEGLTEEIARSHETFIDHYRTTYSEPELPPLWAACEVMSFGQLSKWLENLKYRADQKEIAAPYGLDPMVLGSFLHHLTHIRNLCAHHSRLWNRRLTFTMRLPRNPRHIVGWFNPAAERNLYNTLVMLTYLLGVIAPHSSWKGRLKTLMAECPKAHPSAMGFPTEWEKLQVWK